jgi:hypothetical protein
MNSETGSSNLLATDEHPLDSPRSQSTDQTIRNWIKKADRDDGKSAEGLSTDEREELRELRKELRRGESPIRIWLQAHRHQGSFRLENRRGGLLARGHLRWRHSSDHGLPMKSALHGRMGGLCAWHWISYEAGQLQDRALLTPSAVPHVLDKSRFQGTSFV